jgi:hypothetical protein
MRWWLLCEDQIHERFAMALAPKLGLRTQPLKSFRSPQAEGDASNFVLAQYPHILRKIRTHQNENVCLIVIVDGDDKGIAKRKQMLDEALAKLGAVVLAKTERVVRLIPTWSIDTWCVDPDAQGLNETYSYKRQSWTPSKQQLDQAAMRVVTLHPNEPLPSIVDAHTELSRLK